MKKLILLLGLLATLTGLVCAQEGPVPKGIPHLDHVFVIMMENHGYGQVVNNPNLPYIGWTADVTAQPHQPLGLRGQRGHRGFRT